MNLEDLNASTGLALSVVALCGVVLGWLRWVRPRYHKTRQDGIAIRDAILGREEQRDSITREVVQPALPGIGVRMAHQEQQMSEMTRAVTQLAETHAQLVRMDRTIDDHEVRIDKLETASVERIVTRADSAAAWRAMEAAALAQPDEIADDA